MQQLWRQALWSSATAAALLVALLSSRNDIGAQKASTVQAETQVVSKVGSPSATHSLEADAATRQLAQTVRDLTEDLDRIMTRLAAVEHNIDDLTSSVTQQIDANKDATHQAPTPWTGDETPTTAALAPIVASNVLPPDGFAFPLTPSPLTPVAEESPLEAPSASLPMYGAEIGSASSVKALLARWTEIHAAHAQIFEKLKPVVTLRDNPRANRIELRLVVGSFANAQRAAKLCTSLAAFRIACQPALLNGQQFALQ
jgi:hypothetical protein